MTTGTIPDIHSSTLVIDSPAATDSTADMNDIVHTVLESRRTNLSERKIAWTMVIGCGQARIAGDRERLTSVLMALLIQAEQSIVTAAQTNGAICIRTWARDGEVCCSLSDNGLGASPAPLAKNLSPDLTEWAEIVFDHGGRMHSWRPSAGGASYTIALPAIY